MDYFRPSALHFEKYGNFTSLRPNANPNSEYGKWIREEKRRCWEGYIRKSDGEWVTGYMYWYLNYSPIMLSKIREYIGKDGKKHKSKRADRVEAMPEVVVVLATSLKYKNSSDTNLLTCPGVKPFPTVPTL